MIPLFLCSLAALAVILERAIALRRSRVIPGAVVDVIDAYRGEGSAEAAVATCDRSSASLARLVGGIVQARNEDHPHVIETIHALGRREVERLERGLIVLEIVAGVSPLIGLLGTVLGMVTVFNAIAAEGLGDPRVLSEGISEALITTVAGLIVAIPALAFHSYFGRHVESLAIEMQDLALGFANKLRKFRPGAGPVSEAVPEQPIRTARDAG